MSAPARLVPLLLRLVAAAMRLCRGGLHGACGVGCREAADQTFVEPPVHVLVGRDGIAGFGCVLVVRRRIEFIAQE